MIIKAELNDMNEGIVKAYENWAIKAGLKVTEKTMFRCTKIEVSKEIDDYFWKWYEEKAKKDNPELNEVDIKTGIAMLMLNNGAKRNEALSPWTVEIHDGFVYERID